MELAIALDGLRRNLMWDSLQPIVTCQEDFMDNSYDPLSTNPPGHRFVKCNECNDKTLPEAQRTQGIESTTLILFLTEISLKLFWLKKITQVTDSIPWVRCASGNV